MGDDAIDDTIFLKVAATILVMVVIATMAQSDANNPLAEIGIPVSADSFNVLALGNQAPQIGLITPPDPGSDPTQEQKICWIDWWCPDLPGDEVAKAIYIFAVSFANIVLQIVNGILWTGTVIILLIVNFMLIFNFTGWGAFQGNLFLTLFAVLLTSILGGSVVLWILTKVTGSIPFVGGW